MIAAIGSQVAISIVQFGLPALTFALRLDRGIGRVGFAVLFAAIGIGPALALLPAGRACDRFGARPVLLVGAVAGSLPLALAGIVQRPSEMVVALLLAGVGAAAVPVAGLTAMMAAFPPELRGRVLGLRQAAVPVGGIVGAALLPALHAVGGLRLAFTVPAVLVALGAAGFAAVIGPLEGRRPLVPLRASFPPALRWVMLTGALYVTALGGVLAFTVDALHVAGFSEHAAVALFAVVNVGAAGARIAWGVVADRHGGTHRVATLARLGLIGAASALAFPLAIAHGPALAAAACLALAFGTLGFNAVVYVTAGEVAGSSPGVALGAASTVVFFMGSATVPVLGLVADTFGFAAMFAVCAAFCLAGSWTARRIGAATRAAA